MSRASFRVFGRFNGQHEATVTIDRDTGLMTVRPLRMHRTYELPLSWAAEAVMWKCIKADVAEKQRRRRR